MSDNMGSLNKMKSINKLSMAEGVTAVKEELKEEKLNKYENTDFLNNTEEYKKLKNIRDIIISQLMMLSEEKVSLSEAYPNLLSESLNKQLLKYSDSNISGKEKITNDFLGIKSYELGEKTDDFYSEQHTEQQSERGYTINGSKSERRNVTDKAKDYLKAIEDCNGQQISIKGPKGATLRGYKFSPGEDLKNKKTVILYAGSAGAGCTQKGMGDNIKNYVDCGFTVYQIDYRGYGRSGILKENKNEFVSQALTEKRFYEDGEAILNQVMEDSHSTLSDIILHGFSMGGAVASKVAADLSEELSKREASGEEIHSEDKLGGLVLDSPITVYKDAAKSEGGAAAGEIATWFNGEFSTEKHLNVLSQHRPDIPILFVSGDKTDENADAFSLNKTNIDKKYKFTDSTSRVFAGTSHMDCHTASDVISQKFIGTAGV